jgi:hypothetical protein
LAQCLDERLVGGERLLGAAPVEHERTAIVGQPREFAGQPRFSDARLALQ